MRAYDHEEEPQFPHARSELVRSLRYAGAAELDLAEPRAAQPEASVGGVGPSSCAIMPVRRPARYAQRASHAWISPAVPGNLRRSVVETDSDQRRSP